MVVSLDFLNVGCGRQGDAGDFKEFGCTETLRIPGRYSGSIYTEKLHVQIHFSGEKMGFS